MEEPQRPSGGKIKVNFIKILSETSEVVGLRLAFELQVDISYSSWRYNWLEKFLAAISRQGECCSRQL